MQDMPPDFALLELFSLTGDLAIELNFSDLQHSQMDSSMSPLESDIGDNILMLISAMSLMLLISMFVLCLVVVVLL